MLAYRSDVGKLFAVIRSQRVRNFAFGAKDRERGCRNQRMRPRSARTMTTPSGGATVGGWTPVWNGGGKRGIYSVPTAIDRDRSGLDARIHTTQKPLALMQALVRDFTDEGETILDPFAGSGTTLYAAARLGRKSIGWDRPG